MEKVKIQLIIETKKELTISELNEVMLNMKARLEGYSTECPVSLLGAKISLKNKN